MGTENVKLGACDVKFGVDDLGLTKGGVQVEVTTDTHKVTVDQFGDSEVNEIIMKRTVKARIPMAETTLQNLVRVMPGATLVTDSVEPTKLRVDVTNAIGTDLLSIAQELTLHPTDNLPTDVSEDFTIFKAATAGAIQFAYKVDEERVYNVEFVGYPDQANGNRLFSIGDTTATA